MVMDFETTEITHISENFKNFNLHGRSTAEIGVGSSSGGGLPEEYRFFQDWVDPSIVEKLREVPIGHSLFLPGLFQAKSLRLPFELDLALQSPELMSRSQGVSLTQGVRSERSPSMMRHQSNFDAIVHHVREEDDPQGGRLLGRSRLIVEWLPGLPVSKQPTRGWSLFKDLNEKEAMDRLLEMISPIIPFDRGMIYQFESDGSGTVVAEKLCPSANVKDSPAGRGTSRNNDDALEGSSMDSNCGDAHGLESFLGLRYPATDIPRIVRALYLKYPMRYIADARLPEARVMRVSSSSSVHEEQKSYPFNASPQGASGYGASKARVIFKELDLSPCLCRGVSPYHIRYLNNMGVPSSTSFAIVLGGKLWGLVSLHRYCSGTISYEAFLRVQELVKIFTNHLRTCEVFYQMSFWDQGRLELDDWVKNLALPVIEHGKIVSSPVLQYFGSQEFAFYDGMRWKKFGTQVSDSALINFCKGMRSQTVNGYVETDCLNIEFPELSGFLTDYAGISLMWCTDLTHRSDYFLIFLKRELKKLVTWGSQTTFPEVTQSLEEGVDFDRVSPSTSFGRWQKMMSHHSEPWSRESRFLGRSLITTMIRCLP